MATQVTFNRNLTRADCRKQSFTGVRQDLILKQVEIWVMGTLVKEIGELALTADPQAYEKAYAEVFGINPDQVVAI